MMSIPTRLKNCSCYSDKANKYIGMILLCETKWNIYFQDYSKDNIYCVNYGHFLIDILNIAKNHKFLTEQLWVRCVYLDLILFERIFVHQGSSCIFLRFRQTSRLMNTLDISLNKLSFPTTGVLSNRTMNLQNETWKNEKLQWQLLYRYWFCIIIL